MPRYFENEPSPIRVPVQDEVALNDEQCEALVATVRAVLMAAPIPWMHRAALESLAEYDGQVRGVTLILR
jgi:hypothetical protein